MKQSFIRLTLSVQRPLALVTTTAGIAAAQQADVQRAASAASQLPRRAPQLRRPPTPLSPGRGTPAAAPAQEEKARFRSAAISAFYGSIHLQWNERRRGRAGPAVRRAAQQSLRHLRLAGVDVGRFGVCGRERRKPQRTGVVRCRRHGRLHGATTCSSLLRGRSYSRAAGGAETVTNSSGSASAQAGTFFGPTARAGHRARKRATHAPSGLHDRHRPSMPFP